MQLDRVVLVLIVHVALETANQLQVLVELEEFIDGLDPFVGSLLIKEPDILFDSGVPEEPVLVEVGDSLVDDDFSLGNISLADQRVKKCLNTAVDFTDHDQSLARV